MPTPASISASQLTRVLQISRLLTVTADLDLLLRRIAEAACEVVGCERASIFLHDAVTDELWTKIALQSKEIRVPAGSGIVGYAFETNAVIHVPKPYEDSRFNPEPDRRSGFVTRNLLTAPMLDLDGKPVGVIQAVNKSAGGFDPADETMIELLAGQAGVAIQRYNLQQSAVRAMYLKREMELAKAVQEALIPDTAPRVPGLQAVGWNKTASIAGGDCYDLWATADGRLGIFVGDATGHGIAPALVVSQTRTLIRAMSEVTLDPEKLLASANRRLYEDLDSGTFVTAFVAFVSANGRIDWCSAGHGPVLVRANASGEIESLDSCAPPLGVLSEFECDVISPRQIERGGIFCVATDGITESFSPEGEQFGLPRFLDILSHGVHSNLEDIAIEIKSAMQRWQQTDEPKDDQTLVMVRRSAE